MDEIHSASASRGAAARRALASSAIAITLIAAGGRVGAQSGADFDGDGFDDLAIGVPHETLSPAGAAGVVHILYGSATGLTATGSQIWSQASPGIAGDPEGNDQFGFSMSFGDFDRDGFDDLAISVPNEDVGPAGSRVFDAGAVHVLYGSPSGLTATGSQFLSQAITQLGESAESQDTFGTSLATGDFDGDGFDDLAIGVQNEDVGAVAGAGLVHVVHGSSFGLDVSRSQVWTQESANVPGTAESNDAFGERVVAGDFNGDGRDELAIATTCDNVSGVDCAGSVTVLVGSGSGLSAVGSSLWSQDSAGIPDAAEVLDRFGDALAAADFDGNGRDDLAIGVPDEDVGAIQYAGAVHVIYGGPGGLSAAGTQFWHQDSAGVSDVAEESDKFGLSLVAAHYVGDAKADLVIGVPAEDGFEGVIQIMKGSAAGLVPAAFRRARVLGGPMPGDYFARELVAGDFDGDSRNDLAATVELDDVGALGDAGSVTELSKVYGARFWTQDSAGIDDAVEVGDRFGAGSFHR